MVAVLVMTHNLMPNKSPLPDRDQLHCFTPTTILSPRRQGSTLAKTMMKTANILILVILPHLCIGGELHERPIWLPLGTTYQVCNPGEAIEPARKNDIVAEVYQENDRLKVQTSTLQIIQQPRWFKGSKLPDTILDVPLKNQGASLTLEVRETESPMLLRLVLTLTARDRTVWRELEHRWTNIIPFLFAFTADGKPIGPKEAGNWSKFGGADWMTEVAPAGTSTTWQVALDTESIRTALKGISVKELTMVAAFSEYQHEVLSAIDLSDGRALTEQEFKGPPITIRSNEARLTFDGRTF